MIPADFPFASIVAFALGGCVALLLAKQFSARPIMAAAFGVVVAIGGIVVSGAGVLTPVVLVAGCLSIVALFLVPQLELELPEHVAEATALLLLGTGGAVALASARDVISAVVGLETLALSSVTLVAMSRGHQSLESAFKYFVLGGVSLAATLYGAGLIYLGTGSFAFPQVAQLTSNPLVLVGTVLVALGFAFELAVFPFHWGALDAYTTASPSSAGWVMSMSKLAAAFALGKLVVSAGAPVATVLVWVGVVTIIWGTLGGIAQTELRRMLGFSAITHAGFIALAVGSGPNGPAAAVFYAICYGAMAILTFAALGGRGTGSFGYGQVLGEPMGRWRAAALSLGLFSLSGIPPTPGFWAKVAVLLVAWQSAGPLAAIIATAGGVLAVLYYLRPIPDLFATMRNGASEGRGPSLSPAAGLAAIAVLVLSFAPGLAWFLARP
jgi:NADH-quinone oxidoreductase subunit N